MASESNPIIAFGQQPCGFFPKRFLAAKIFTARRLQKEIGGRIVFFYHDADHDPRETKTVLRHRQSGQPLAYNFDFENKIQRKFSPLSHKRIIPAWQTKMTRALPNYVSPELAAAFGQVTAKTVADFCLEMYRAMGLLEGVTIARSSDPALRQAACDISDYFVDVPYEHEIVRARRMGDSLQLHEGGSAFIDLPLTPHTKEQISPTRDSRLLWMQSVIHCTHYICGAGEKQYLDMTQAPEIAFVGRDPIERSDEAWTEINN